MGFYGLEWSTSDPFGLQVDIDGPLDRDNQTNGDYQYELQDRNLINNTYMYLRNVSWLIENAAGCNVYFSYSVLSAAAEYKLASQDRSLSGACMVRLSGTKLYSICNQQSSPLCACIPHSQLQEDRGSQSSSEWEHSSFSNGFSKSTTLDMPVVSASGTASAAEIHHSAATAPTPPTLNSGGTPASSAKTAVSPCLILDLHLLQEGVELSPRTAFRRQQTDRARAARQVPPTITPSTPWSSPTPACRL
jgi:hypothetical protein